MHVLAGAVRGVTDTAVPAPAWFGAVGLAVRWGALLGIVSSGRGGCANRVDEECLEVCELVDVGEEDCSLCCSLLACSAVVIEDARVMIGMDGAE